MNEINIVNLDEVTKLLVGKSLSDKDFTKSDLLNAAVDKPIELDGISFAFGASGSFSIQLFNSPDDVDDDKLIGTAAENSIQFDPAQAWLKYSVRSDLKAAAGFDLGSAGFDITGEKSLIFTSYRVHKDPNAKLQESILKDFNPYLFLANASHPEKLNPGEILSVRMPGKLSTTIAVSWSDLFTGNLSLFQKLLGPNQLFSLDINAAVSADFTVELQDDFSLQIRRNAGDTFDVFLNKATSSKLGGSVAASIGVAFKDKDAVKKALGLVTEGLFGKLKGKIQPILDKNPLNNLSDSEKAIVLEVAKALGLDSDLIKTVGDFASSLHEKLGTVIEEVANSKVQAGFAYEYNRVSTTEVVLQAELTKDALKTYHSSLIRFKLNGFGNGTGPGLLSDFRKAEEAGQPLPGVTLKNYLNEQTISRTQSWGFSLGIGKWTLEGKDNKQINETIRENSRGNRQIAFKGVRGYNGNLFGSENNWRVDFNAEMERFSQNPMPLVNELTYSLFLMSEWKKPKSVSQETIGHIVDQAILWQVLPQDQFDTVQQQLQDLLANKNTKNIRASVHLSLNPDTFVAILLNIGFLIQHKPLDNATLMATSLGAAMAYRKDFAVRKNVALRAKVYGPLWAACLIKANKTENNNPIEPEERSALGFAASDRLKEFSENMLAAHEVDAKLSQLPNEDLFTSSLAVNPNVRVDWSAFRSGILMLSNGFNQGLIYADVVKKSFTQMQCFWGQEHYVRALGHYLLSFANNSFLLDGVNRSLTVSYEVDGEKKVLNMIGKVG
ncbi:hypothetical protein [Spirosoma sp.]|uniref:hypothetical protein n=1 Tax=Spirosoma sp. TaxID=1899569 RepID=UPI00262A487F|nr:hypothetical protein [Spirosoma sp.]MCX6217867.1 hypothetical protein [Spirosoma sp.]